MFEEMTYENILEEMLERVTSDVDKREGSIIYDALAPCAYQLAQIYFNLSNYVDLVTGDTAVGEYLDRVVADYGITRKAATYAVRQIETSGPVDIGTRWGINDTTYTITTLLSTNVYSTICDQSGEAGNTYTGTLDNIDNVNGITAALTDIIKSGEDEETDEALRKRFNDQVQSSSTSGNIADYKKWALGVAGVGGTKVFPLWNGPGTVKILIIDENMSIDPALPETVATYIETVRPIGAAVTVDNPTDKIITVSANIILDGTKTYEQVIAEFTSSYTGYLRSIVFNTYFVSYAKIGSLLLSTPGVADYSDMLLNNDTINVGIGETEIPIVGTVTLTEVSQ